MLFVRLAGIAALLGSIVSLACGGPSPTPRAAAPTAAPPGAAAPAMEPPRPAATSDAETVTGTVAETMNSGGYTYARLTGPDGDKWLAAPEILAVKIGDVLTGTVSMPMHQFRSRTLNREFDTIYFVSRLSRNGEVLPPARDAGGANAVSGSHPAAPAPEAKTDPVAPAPGGLTIADVWARRAALAGKPILVRGRVVKANYQIMGVNWYHLRDGSGTEEAGTNDLVITSDTQAKVGDVVTISGALTTDKDFGAGYAYQAIVEKASIK